MVNVKLNDEQRALCEDNMSLVPWTYHRYIDKSQAAKAYKDELLSAGYEGLVLGCAKFDENMTYTDDKGVERHIQPSTFLVRSILNYMMKEMKRFIKPALQCTSYDAPIAEDCSPMLNFLVDEQTSNMIDDAAVHDEVMFKIDEIEKILSAKEIAIVTRLADGQTLQNVADEFGVTRQRIHQLRAQAIDRVRNEFGQEHKITRVKHLEVRNKIFEEMGYTRSNMVTTYTYVEMYDKFLELRKTLSYKESIVQVAKEYGYSRDYVYKVIRLMRMKTKPVCVEERKLTADDIASELRGVAARRARMVQRSAEARAKYDEQIAMGVKSHRAVMSLAMEFGCSEEHIYTMLRRTRTPEKPQL